MAFQSNKQSNVARVAAHFNQIKGLDKVGQIASVHGNERTQAKIHELKEQTKAIKSKPVSKPQPVVLDAWQRELLRLGF